MPSFSPAHNYNQHQPTCYAAALLSLGCYEQGKVGSKDPFKQYGSVRGLKVHYGSATDYSTYPEGPFDVVYDNNGKDMDSCKMLIDAAKVSSCGVGVVRTVWLECSLHMEPTCLLVARALHPKASSLLEVLPPLPATAPAVMPAPAGNAAVLPRGTGATKGRWLLSVTFGTHILRLTFRMGSRPSSAS